MMDAEIEKKLGEILYRFAEEYSAADYLHSEENGIKPNLNWRVKNATNKISELVVGTIPDEVVDDDIARERGFNICRTEMLSRWTNKEKL